LTGLFDYLISIFLGAFSSEKGILIINNPLSNLASNLDKLNFKPIIESLSNQKKEYYYRISAPKYNESVEYDENPYNMLNKIRNLISPSNPIYKSVNNDDNVISFTVNKKVLDDYPDRMRGDDLSIKFIKDEYFRVKYISRNAFNFKYFECDQFEGLIQLLKDMGLKLNERVMESKLDRPNYKKLDIDGFIVYQGKDAKSNDYVTFELSDDEDYWLHAHNFPGSHLLIKIKDKLPQIETIKKVAELAAKNSKAPNGDVVVVWCKKKFVKKEISMNIGQVKVDYINSNKITIVK